MVKMDRPIKDIIKDMSSIPYFQKFKTTIMKTNASTETTAATTELLLLTLSLPVVQYHYH